MLGKQPGDFCNSPELPAAINSISFKPPGNTTETLLRIIKIYENCFIAPSQKKSEQNPACLFFSCDSNIFDMVGLHVYNGQLAVVS